MAMDIHLLIDFGSTYTKIFAVDLEREEILGRAQALTTIEHDITIGLQNALSELSQACGFDEGDIRGKYASSSAAGGLRMAAIGLVPDLTLEAAQRATLGAGAKVVCAHGFEIDQTIIEEVEQAACDIILLTGGTDGGDKETILHNARMLAGSAINCPILVAGNRVASTQVQDILQAAGKVVAGTKNVLPSLDKVEVEPAQELIREIFITRITEAKGLSKARDFIAKEIVPTPMATLRAAALLADGTDDEEGLGSLLVVEVGGATTNIHSVGEGRPSDAQTIVKGLPEARVKRTVEGDLGIRYNAPSIHDMVGEEACRTRLQEIDPETGKRVSRLNPEHEWISREVPALHIIDDQTWEKVQQIKARYSSQPGNKRQTKKRLLTGLVKCGCCGGSMTIINRERYYCSARRERGTCDSAIGIKAADLEERVLAGLKDILLGNEHLIKAFAMEFKAEVARLRKQRGARGRQAHKDLDKVNAAIARCISFITGGDGDPGLVRDELRTLVARKRELEQAKAAKQVDQVIEVHPNMAELYARKVMQLQSLLTDETTRPQATELIRAMVVRIDVRAGEERGKPEVILEGALAQILTFVQQSKTAASMTQSVGGGGRVLMVAGAGFGLYRTSVRL